MPSEKVLCPICNKEVSFQGLNLHVKKSHPDQYNTMGYEKIKETSLTITEAVNEKNAELHQQEEMRKIEEMREREKIEQESLIEEDLSQYDEKAEPIKMSDKLTEKIEKIDASNSGVVHDKGPEAWLLKTSSKIWFSPTPFALAMINQFADKRAPSDFINTAILYYARSKHGLEPALIKVAGAETVGLIDRGANSEGNIENLMKIATLSAQMNQSYNQNTPLIQAMNMMKDRVDKGIGMKDFMNEMVKMMLLNRMMEGM